MLAANERDSGHQQQRRQKIGKPRKAEFKSANFEIGKAINV